MRTNNLYRHLQKEKLLVNPSYNLQVLLKDLMDLVELFHMQVQMLVGIIKRCTHNK